MSSHKKSLFILPFLAMISLHANDPFGDDLFQEMYRMQQNMDKTFAHIHQQMRQNQHTLYSNQLLPSPLAKNLFEDKGESYTFDTGIKEKENNQIEINVEQGVLHLKTTQSTHQNQNNLQSSSMRMSQTSHTLPQDADASTLKSSYENGLLILSFDKIKSIKKTIKPQESNSTTTTKEG